MAADRFEPGLPPRVIEDLLAEPRRRELLRTLVGAERPLSLDHLARTVAAEGDTTPEAVERETCLSVRETIRADDLPKLLATDVVRYHSDLDALELSPTGEQLRERLRG